MLFTRRKPVATSAEGTQGKYSKRESPPTVPSLAATAVSRTRRNPIASSTLILSTVPSTPTSTPPPEFEMYHSGDPSVEETEIEDVEHQEDSFDLNDLKEIEFERLHSRSTASENDVYTEPSDEPSTSFGVRNNNVLSSRSFNRGALRYVPRKSLTASHSIGNVEQGMRELSISEKRLASPQPPRFQSLQTLPSEHLMAIQQYRSSCDCTSDLPLPENWAVEFTTENQPYFVDHSNRRTHWVHPLVHESLKPGWKKFFDPQKGVFYYNEEMKRTQYEHPGISNPIFRTESVNVASRSQVDLNANLHIIEEKELPPWLLMYAQSDSSLDHLLEWDLFNFEQLTEYEHLMMKLYKQEVFDIVKKYEKKRNVLNREIHRRDVSRPPPPRINEN
uniref:WW domain-containing protein n=1 Tax=Caenorhabditis tropicalis TaxID=1561998 RepID=A0A1I7TC00_9PELO